MRALLKEKRLQKYGYFAQKGKFGYVKRNTKKMRSSMKKKGGSNMEILAPSKSGASSEGGSAPTSFPAAANAGSGAAKL